MHGKLTKHATSGAHGMSTTQRTLLIIAMATLAAGQAQADFIKGPWLQDVTPSSIMVLWEADALEDPAPEVRYGLTTALANGYQVSIGAGML